MGALFALVRTNTKPAHATGQGVIEVDVVAKPYDEDGSAPDLKICILRRSYTVCDTRFLGTCQDRYSCTYRLVFPIPDGCDRTQACKGEAFTVHVWDADLLADDYIGVASCAQRQVNWRKLKCDAAAPIRAVTLHRL